jgi:hypothetical protein
MLKKYLKNNTIWTQLLFEIVVISKVIFESNKLIATKINSDFHEDPMVNEWNSKSNGQERMGHQKHNGAPLLTLLILLERYQRDDSNHTLKNHQTWF